MAMISLLNTESGSSKYHLSSTLCTVNKPGALNALEVITSPNGLGPVFGAGTTVTGAGAGGTDFFFLRCAFKVKVNSTIKASIRCSLEKYCLIMILNLKMYELLVRL